MLEKNTTYIKNDTIEKLSCHDWSGKDEKHFAGKLKVIKYKNQNQVIFKEIKFSAD